MDALNRLEIIFPIEYSMENNNKNYQVAYSYQQYLNSLSSFLKKDITPLPSLIPQEKNSTTSIAESHPLNIFSNPIIIDCRNQTLPSKEYECVGFKELQSYATKFEKKKRRINSMLKRGSQSALSFSRVSQSKVSTKYMTKEVVIELYGKENHKKSVPQLQETYISNEKTILRKTLSSRNTTLRSCLYTAEQSYRNPISNIDQFSLNRLNQKINTYKEEWQRQLSRKKLAVFHKRNKTVKLQSILKNSQSFREKMQRLEQNSIKELNENVQPKMWNFMLRNPRPIKKTVVVQKVLRDGLGCNGKSKLEKETTWIEEKDRLGFFFKDQKQGKQSILA